MMRRTFMAIPPPLLRGRRQAALRRRAALQGALVGAGARPKAAASGLASIKHAKLQARIIVAFRQAIPAEVFRQRGALIAIQALASEQHQTDRSIYLAAPVSCSA
jgi:hypothetical protein